MTLKGMDLEFKQVYFKKYRELEIYIWEQFYKHKSLQRGRTEKEEVEKIRGQKTEYLGEDSSRSRKQQGKEQFLEEMKNV